MSGENAQQSAPPEAFAALEPVLPHLRCPVTARPLEPMRADALGELNARIKRGGVNHLGGAEVREPLDAALVDRRRQLAYRVDDGIALLLASSAIPLGEDAPATPAALQADKAAVQDFYEQLGWTRAEGEAYVDAERWEDMRPVSEDYIRRCRRRVGEHIEPTGRLLLDVASGPVQYEEYLDYSRGYERHVCVDLSLLALREARRRLGRRGAFILGDITRLPFSDDAFDAVVSLHTIYHVPADEQPAAFKEVFRVLATDRTAAVVYSWGNAAGLPALARLPRFPLRLAKTWLRKLRGLPPAEPPLYFHPHSRRWFVGQGWPFDYELRCWRSLNAVILRALVHPRLGGRAMLRALFDLEDRFPNLFSRLGQYPLIVIRK